MVTLLLRTKFVINHNGFITTHHHTVGTLSDDCSLRIAGENATFAIELPSAVKPSFCHFVFHGFAQHFLQLSNLFERGYFSFTNSSLQHAFHVFLAFYVFHQTVEQCSATLSSCAFCKEIGIFFHNGILRLRCTIAFLCTNFLVQSCNKQTRILRLTEFCLVLAKRQFYFLCNCIDFERIFHLFLRCTTLLCRYAVSLICIIFFRCLRWCNALCAGRLRDFKKHLCIIFFKSHIIYRFIQKQFFYRCFQSRHNAVCIPLWHTNHQILTCSSESNIQQIEIFNVLVASFELIFVFINAIRCQFIHFHGQHRNCIVRCSFRFCPNHWLQVVGTDQSPIAIRNKHAVEIKSFGFMNRHYAHSLHNRSGYRNITCTLEIIKETSDIWHIIV